MKTSKIIVVDYNNEWPMKFDVIKSELADCLGEIAMLIEHVGSTSVPGMAAKPIIDIDVVIDSEEQLQEVIELLKTIGYVHEGDLGIKGRDAFKYQGKEHLQTHHLYVCPKDSDELRRHITFRDYLRANPLAVSIYSSIKKEGAELYPNDIDRYIEYKSSCIKSLYKKCGLDT